MNSASNLSQRFCLILIKLHAVGSGVLLLLAAFTHRYDNNSTLIIRGLLKQGRNKLNHFRISALYILFQYTLQILFTFVQVKCIDSATKSRKE